MALYPFKLGNFICTVIYDSAFTYKRPAQILFPQVPQAQVAEALQPYGIALDTWGHQLLPNLCLLVETGQQRVLIDTGGGPSAPSAGRLQTHLQTLGIPPAAIDVVILSHAHLDHSGGNLDQQGELAFPNARYMLATAEWNFWMDKPDLSALQMDEPIKQKLTASIRRNLQPLRPHLALVDDGAEFVPGIRALRAPGHTPGQLAVALCSKGEELIYLADTVLHPLHLQQPAWIPAVDLRPDESVLTRRRLLDHAATTKTLVHLYHFPFPGLGYVVAAGAGWRWQALDCG